ncbi:nucleotide-binding protein [Terrihabitans sp. B22-R8]|uniref:nucleotide-binding protein n=1 Tax=Terrihabitans sp. B22-R8 TaxID=3425128 RepID=UPI00403C21B2
MLQVSRQIDIAQTVPAGGTPLPDDLELLTAIRLYWPILLGFCVAAVLVALAIIATTQPTYVAATKILFDPGTANDEQGAPQRAFLRATLDASQIESQIQILESEQIARAVIEAHDLGVDPEFANPPPSLVARIRGLLSSSGSSVPTYGAIAGEFAGKLDVRRVGQSYVIEVRFHSIDPEKATRLANAVTAAYISRQLDAHVDEAQRRSQFERTIRDLSDANSKARNAIRTGVIDIAAFPSSDGRVISAALVPTGPSAPRKGVILGFALSLGLMAGGASALLRHRLTRTIRHRSHIEDRLGLNFLGNFRLPAEGPEIPSVPSPDIRTIRTSFERTTRSAERQCIGVTSLNPREGKSTTALNLALAFAASGRKTLLVDASAHDAELSGRLIDQSWPHQVISLVRMMAGAPDLKGMIVQRPMGNLHFMPLGADGGHAELSDAFEAPESDELFGKLRERYERVVIDLSPFSVLPDAWAVAQHLDAYVLVVKAGRTRLAETSAMVQALTRTGAKIAGVIINE